MDFIKATKFLGDQVPVRRAEWEPQVVLKLGVLGEFLLIDGNITEVYEPCYRDVIATDWEAC